jgi:hypothetical protein
MNLYVVRDPPPLHHSSILFYNKIWSGYRLAEVGGGVQYIGEIAGLS